MRRFVFCALVVLGGFVTTPASAAPSAEQLFNEGVHAKNQGDFDTACAKFAESQRIGPAGGTLLNLGQCEERRGHFAAAEDFYLRAEKTFTNAAKAQFARQNAARVAPRVASYVLKASKTPGVVVHEDDEVIPADEVTKRDPGEITLRAEAPGYKPKELKATLVGGEETTIEVGELEKDEPKPAPVVVVAAKPPSTTGLSTLSTVGLVVGAVGVASLATGAVTGVLALGRASTVKDHCDDALACDAQGVDAADAGSTLSTISTITVAAGAALAIGGGAMFFLGRRAKSNEHALVVPSASPTFAGLFVAKPF